MSIAVSAEHRALADSVRSLLDRRGGRRAARACLEGAPSLPDFWDEMVAQGWLGLHVPEELGGAGFSVAELAVVVNELGRAVVPGPFVPNAVVAGVLASHGGAELAKKLLPSLLDGTDHVGLAIGQDGVALGGAEATIFAHVVDEDLVLVRPDTEGAAVRKRADLDPSRACAVVDLAAADHVATVSGAGGPTRDLLLTLLSAEAAGLLTSCREMTTQYAKERIAFGRPIGSFQAIKHYCAGLFIDEETAAAAAWQAARQPRELGAPASLAAAVIALSAAERAAKLMIQVHGGIGFTWEHDAHLFLRRAAATAAFVGGESALSTLLAGYRDEPPAAALELPPETETVRREVRAFLDVYRKTSPADRHELALREGYLFPHWPRPWGRGAGPAEQLVLEQELVEMDHPSPLGPTAWTLPILLPTIITHGTDEQRDRWVRPTMMGELAWCQLFSEPGAGSDLASLTTRGVRAEGGWLVTGQKVWTSHAHLANRGFALVRTDPAAPKHRGITCMVIDMSAPGVLVRPLRQISGDAEFNEVFLDDVFVSDADVIGEPGAGWKVARTTLGNERVSLSEGGWGIEGWWRELQTRVRDAQNPPAECVVELGRLTALEWTLRAMNLRAAMKALDGADTGTEANVTKLLTGEHAQRMADLGRALAGREAVFADGAIANDTTLFFGSRSMTIAGGTSEIIRNVIAERILGLPRDPLPS